MQKINVWNQFNLSRLQVLVVCFGLLFCLTAFEQAEAQWIGHVKHRQSKYKRKAHHSVKKSKKRHFANDLNYGFFIGGHTSRFVYKPTDAYATTKPKDINDGVVPQNISPRYSFGFSFVQ